MAESRRKWKGNPKALLHFDYAYPGEPGDGLRDEIGIEAWSRVGSPKWVGVEAPVDQVVVGAPMFGWRCPQFSGAGCYIKGLNTQNIWNMSSTGSYEIEFFLRVTNSTAGNIFALRNISGDLFAVAKNSSNQLTLTSTFWGINGVATKALKTDFFHHIMLRISNKAVKIFLDGEQVITHNLTVTELLDVIEVRIGEFVGQMDEFAFRHSAKMSTPVVPTEPYNAYLDMRLLGGAGDGAFGDITISSGTQQINTYGMVASIAVNGTDITLGVTSNGIYGAFDRGQEVLVHISAKKGTEESELGKYALRKVVDYRGTVLVLDRAITEEFALDSAAIGKYYIQVISAPNYNNLAIEAVATIIPAQWDIKYGGGIVAFKCRKNLNLNGKILTSGKMADCNDSLCITHSDIIDRFLLGSGGGVFSVVGGIASSSANARIGAIQAGDLGKGVGGLGGLAGAYSGVSTGTNGENGTSAGAGYGGGAGGGSGSGAYERQYPIYSKPGGNGVDGAIGRAGSGGAGGGQQSLSSVNGQWSDRPGGAGGLAGQPRRTGGQASTSGAFSGSTIIMLAKRNKIDTASISTGGCASEGAPAGAPGTMGKGAGGGGGTGFAYIATRRDV